MFEGAEALARVGGARRTYRDVERCMHQGAAQLVARGLRPGQRVLLDLDPGPDWVCAFFAILDAGLTAVPLPPGLPPEMQAAIASRTEAAAAVTRESSQGISASELFTGRGGSSRHHELALLAFTSGSTSTPRAVELTHANLLFDLKALLARRGAQPGDAFLSLLPPAHLFELMGGLLGPLACGARVVYPGPPLPNRILDALATEGITHAMAVPALLAAIYQQVVRELAAVAILDPDGGSANPDEALRRIRFESNADHLRRVRDGVRQKIGPRFRAVVVGGAAVDPALAEILATHGIRVEVGYGLTEASPIVSVGVARECPPGSVGRPLPGVEVRIGDDGEILLRGGNIMRGYFRDQGATRAAFTDGWLRTGDRGRLDEAGFLFVTGRLKEAMVTAAGETIHPEEVEPHYRSDLFSEYCVAAVPGPDGNDQPTLFVVSPAPEEEIAAEFARLRTATPPRLRVVRWIRVEKALPRTPSGKVQRRALGEEHART